MLNEALVADEAVERCIDKDISCVKEVLTARKCALDDIDIKESEIVYVVTCRRTRYTLVFTKTNGVPGVLKSYKAEDISQLLLLYG